MSTLLQSREPITHELKCHPGPYQATKRGDKPFEWRFDNRDFRVGDTLWLREWNPDWYPQTPQEAGQIGDDIGNAYTGDELRRIVTYIIREGFGIPPGYCIMGLARDHALLSGEGAACTECGGNNTWLAAVVKEWEANDPTEDHPDDSADLKAARTALRAEMDACGWDVYGGSSMLFVRAMNYAWNEGFLRGHMDATPPPSQVDQGVTMSREPVRLPMNRYRYIVLISGGLGPDVWDKETTIEANDLLQAASVAHEAAIECGGHVVHIEQDDELTSTEVSAPMDPAPITREKEPLRVDDLANEIRRVDGSNSLGAGALAEALMPFLNTPSDGN